MAQDSNPTADVAIWRVVAVASLGPLMTNLDATAVNVALSAMGHSFDAPVPTIQWVSTAYLLALALALPVTGWLVDRFGVRLVYVACFCGFSLASLLCGLSQSAEQLIAARVLQGIAGGLLTPLAQLAVARAAGPQLARFMGIVSLPVLLGAILGPVVAGVLVQGPGWPSIFFLNLPIGVVATTLAWFLLPRDAGAAKARPFDLFGFLLLAPGLAGLLFGLERIGPPRGDLSAGAPILIGATVLLVGFLVVAARRKGRSLIDIRLFADRFFATASVTQFLANGAVLGGQLLLPLYLLDALHLEAAHTGWLLSVVGVGALLSYPVMGKVIDRFGPRVTTVAGAAIGLAGTLPFLFAGSIPPSMAAIVVALALRGLSIGAVSVPSIAVAYRDMPATNIAQATTALNIVQRLGGPVATTFIALALSASPLSRRAGAVPSFITAFALLAALYLVLAIVAIALPRRRSRPLSNPISHPSSTTENPS